MVADHLDPATLRAAHHRLHVKTSIIAVAYLVSFTGVVLASDWLKTVLATASHFRHLRTMGRPTSS